MTGTGSARSVLWPLVVLILAAVVWIWVPGTEKPFSESSTEVLEPVGSGSQSSSEAVMEPLPEDREEAVETEVPPSAAEDRVETDRVESVPTSELRGMVLDLEGRPRAGVDIVLRVGGAPVRSLGRSDGGGRFAVALPFPEGELIAVEEGWVALRGTRFGPTNLELEHVLVLAPSLALAGQVVDSERQPVAKAAVRFALDPAAWTHLTVPLDKTFTPHSPWRVETDAEGRFRIARAVVSPAARLSAFTDDGRRASLTAPQVDTTDVEIVLSAADDSEPTPLRVTGRVVDGEGQPVADAEVRLPGSSTRTDPQGRFELAGETAPDHLVLCAWKRGYGPAVLESFGQRLREHVEQWPDLPPNPVELRLGEILAIEGRLVSGDGRGQEGFRVMLLDPTILDDFSIPFRTVETPGWNRGDPATTGEGGRFRIEGLLDRPYQLRFLHPTRLIRHDSDPIEAGSKNAIVRLPIDAVRDRLEGRVVSRTGVPVPRVSVAAAMISMASETGHTWESGSETVTNEGGRFVLGDVPRRHLLLELAGEAILPTKFEVPEVLPGAGLEVVVSLRCFVQVEPGTGPIPYAFEVHDAAGETLIIHDIRRRSRSSTSRKVLDEGRSRALAVDDTAATVIFYDRSGRVLGSVPWSPVPGEVVPATIDG